MSPTEIIRGREVVIPNLHPEIENAEERQKALAKELLTFGDNEKGDNPKVLHIRGRRVELEF